MGFNDVSKQSALATIQGREPVHSQSSWCIPAKTPAATSVGRDQVVMAANDRGRLRALNIPGRHGSRVSNQRNHGDAS